MNRRRLVPGIAQLPNQFARSSQPPILSPMMIGQSAGLPQQAPPEASESMHDMAEEIYVRLVVDHFRSCSAPDPQALRSLAQSAQSAARAYFESMGVQIDG